MNEMTKEQWAEYFDEDEHIPNMMRAKRIMKIKKRKAQRKAKKAAGRMTDGTRPEDKMATRPEDKMATKPDGGRWGGK